VGGSKRQLGRRKKGEEFKLSLSQVELIANRYRVARRLETTVNYEGASAHVNFRLFKGNADKLRDQENYVIAMLRMALKRQQQIDDGDREKTSEEWAQEVLQLQLAHKEDIDALQNDIRVLEGANTRLKADLQKTSDEYVQAVPKELQDETMRLIEENASQKKEMNELRTQIEKVESEKIQLNRQLQQQSGAIEKQLEEARADNLKLQQKVDAVEHGHVTQAELDKRKVELDKQAKEQALERTRLQGQQFILERKEKEHQEKVVKDTNTHEAWMRERDAILHDINQKNAEFAEHERYARTLDEWARKCQHEEREKYEVQVAYDNLKHITTRLEDNLRDVRRDAERLHQEVTNLRLWMRSLDACSNVEIAIDQFVEARTAGCTLLLLHYLEGW
jgi:myosin heavy subunit